MSRKPSPPPSGPSRAVERVAPPAEADKFLAAHPDVDAIDMVVTTMSGVPRGKRLRAHEAAAVYRDGRLLPASVIVTDITGRDTEETGLLWETGDADQLARPVPGTMSPMPWHGGAAAQFLASFYDLDGTPNELDPRHVLARVLGRFAELGLTPVAAVELEFYLVDPARDAAGALQPAASPRDGRRSADNQVYGLRELDDVRPFLDDLYAGADAAGLPLEAAISEYSPGQFELTLRHRADALQAADEAILYKRMVKGIAPNHGMEATFMAKPFAQQAGSGMHLHLSLASAGSTNLFAGAGEVPPLLRHAIGGMRAAIADSMAIFAPNANSYRRFRANSYAPVAANWGINNRTVSFRVTAGAPGARHVEHRVAGADANPYLALAAVLAGVHHGIVAEIDPGEAVVGNGYETTGTAADLPNNWFAAVDRFAASPLMQDYLGEHFVSIFSIVKRAEQAHYFAQVPEIDYAWYLRTA